MDTKESHSKTVAYRAERRILCAPATIRGLTAEQQSDLHLFKHELLAAVHRLYQRVPPNLADPIIGRYFAFKREKIEEASPGDAAKA